MRRASCRAAAVLCLLPCRWCLVFHAAVRRSYASDRRVLARRATLVELAQQHATTAKTPKDESSHSLGNFRLAPPMTLKKYRTMQQKRVRLSIKYSGGERYALQTYKRMKEIINSCFPDVVVEKHIREVRSSRDTGKFELLVDDRVVYQKPPERQGIFLSMRTLAAAVERARRLRRPGTAYGDTNSSVKVGSFYCDF
mmetsp:Transcript_13754/g.43442  ORF Transcript_13754/g.43442 Transcript_13754/m.43442 type:complete len:197 (+) Transcript_13754:30-620(+)